MFQSKAEKKSRRIRNLRLEGEEEGESRSVKEVEAEEEGGGGGAFPDFFTGESKLVVVIVVSAAEFSPCNEAEGL